MCCENHMKRTNTVCVCEWGRGVKRRVLRMLLKLEVRIITSGI
jgi:hypothetical protein